MFTAIKKNLDIFTQPQQQHQFKLIINNNDD